MLLKELMEQYGNWEVDEDDLVTIMTPPVPSTVWDLNNTNLYYYFNDDGVLCDVEWYSRAKDFARRSIGNIFLTEEEAKKRVNQLEIENLLIQYGGSRQFIEGGYVIGMLKDSKDSESMKVKPCYMGYCHQQGAIYFATREECKNAINEIGEKEIKSCLFDIYED